MIQASSAARDRRPAPGSHAYREEIIVAGTIRLIRRWLKSGALIAPLDLDPGALTWPVAGKSVVVITTGAPEEFSLRLVQALIADKAELVVKIDDGRASFHTQPPPEMS